MMPNKVTSLLNDALAELNVRITVPENKLGLVEFCLTQTSLRGEDLINFCENVLATGSYSVYLQESVASQIGQRIGQSWNTVTNGAGANRANTVTNAAGEQVPNTAGKPIANGPIASRSDIIGNFFGTSGAKTRNGGMIEVTKDGVTKYLSFPELDMSRPGHHRILTQLVDAENKSGGKAQEIPVNNALRAGVRAVEVRLANTAFKNMVKDRDSIVKSLNDLSNYANQQKLQLSKYAFVTQEEAQEIANKISAYTNIFGQATQAASKDEQTDIAQAPSVVDKTNPGPTTGNTFQNEYNKNVTANITPAGGASPSATPAAPGASPSATPAAPGASPAVAPTPGTTTPEAAPTPGTTTPEAAAGSEATSTPTAKTVSTSLSPQQYIRQGKRVSASPAPMTASQEQVPASSTVQQAPNVVNFNPPQTATNASFTPTGGMPNIPAPSSRTAASNYMFGQQDPRRALSNPPSRRVGITTPRRVPVSS
ncbi:MAG: hypothetical protein JHC33_11900 [Ignisphaera sp.]|nr:hypothetical protein [Ignisphaera sp.]